MIVKAKVLVALRKHFNLTQQDLANMAGLSPLTIYNLESGRVLNPTLATLDRIATAVHIPTSWLVQDDPDSPRCNSHVLSIRDAQ